jgi:hypothetical protein
VYRIRRPRNLPPLKCPLRDGSLGPLGAAKVERHRLGGSARGVGSSPTSSIVPLKYPGRELRIDFQVEREEHHKRGWRPGEWISCR